MKGHLDCQTDSCSFVEKSMSSETLALYSGHVGGEKCFSPPMLKRQCPPRLDLSMKGHLDCQTASCSFVEKSIDVPRDSSFASSMSQQPRTRRRETVSLPPTWPGYEAAVTPSSYCLNRIVSCTCHINRPWCVPQTVNYIHCINSFAWSISTYVVYSLKFYYTL